MATTDANTEVITTARGLFTPVPETPHERIIAEYLETHASEPLRGKIAIAIRDGYGIDKCYEYITREAMKQAADNHSVMIADDVVYGWAVHYYEDEWSLEKERDAAEEARRKEAEARRARLDAERAELEAERKREEERLEEEKLAAMSDEERAAYLREKARRDAEVKAREAAAMRAAEEAERKRRDAARRREEREAKRRAKEELEKAQLTLF